MNILIISDAWHPQVNGVVRTYEYIINELKEGHDIRVIGPADFPRRIPMPGYPEIELALFPAKRLHQLIEDAEPDAIHIATEGPLGRAARAYCKKNDLAYTTAYHTHFPAYIAKRVPRLSEPLKKITIKMLRAFHNDAACIFVATPSLEAELRNWGFTAPMHRLTRGAQLELFRPGDKTVYHNLPTPVALYVGRVAVEKNIEAFLKMNWSGSKVIVGDGPDKDALERKYPDALFVGTKEGEELGAHYRSADIFVFPSRTDTFGMVLVEALASGLPVAAYNATGPRDIITNDLLGALCEEDLADAARKALTVAHHTQERRSHVEEYYTWPVVAEQFLSVIRKVGL